MAAGVELKFRAKEDAAANANRELPRYYVPTEPFQASIQITPPEATTVYAVSWVISSVVGVIGGILLTRDSNKPRNEGYGAVQNSAVQVTMGEAGVVRLGLPDLRREPGGEVRVAIEKELTRQNRGGKVKGRSASRTIMRDLELPRLVERDGDFLPRRGMLNGAAGEELHGRFAAQSTPGHPVLDLALERRFDAEQRVVGHVQAEHLPFESEHG